VTVQPTHRVLCATDFSPAANQATQIAVAMAKALGEGLQLLHVVQVPPQASAEASAKLMGLLRDAAEQQLAGEVEALSGRGVEVSGRVELGLVDEVLLFEAASTASRLLVLGTHSRKGISRFLGSVAERTVGKARCPVLVVPEATTGLRDWLPGRRPLRVTAGVDASLATEAVAQTLRAIAQVVPVELDLVHWYWPPREHERLGLAWQAEHRSDELIDAVLGREVRARVGHILESPHREARIRLCPVWGDEAEPLLKEARAHKADLVAVGVSGRGLGSTAAATLRASEIPVLCVPAADTVEHALRTELPPIRTVLVPFDFSPLATEALPHAYRVAGRNVKVIIAHVAETDALGLAPDVRADLEKDLDAYVPRQGWASGHSTHTLVFAAKDAAEGILQLARRLGVDLIVMSSHGRTGLKRAVLGSVAEAVTRNASVPVVVVPVREGGQS
jgi:nucleotide-binding universal stress UspA family protein